MIAREIKSRRRLTARVCGNIRENARKLALVAFRFRAAEKRSGEERYFAVPLQSDVTVCANLRGGALRVAECFPSR